MLGAAAKRWSHLPPTSHHVWNFWVLNISLPALVLHSVRHAKIDISLLLGAGTLWGVFVFAVVVSLAARKQGWLTTKEAGGMALAIGLGNTAFVGLPLIEALGGSEAVSLAVVLDQLGSFGALSLLAIPFASSLAGRSLSPVALLKKLLRFPPMIALLAAFLLRGVPFPTVIEGVLEKLAEMLSPLALASVGWQFNPSALRGRLGRAALGLLARLVVVPGLATAFLWLVRGHIGLIERVTIAQVAMGPMVTGVVLAAEYDLDAELGAAMLAVGVPLSLVTVPIWWKILGS